MIDEARKRELVRAALEAREGSYAPYSRFLVGAALLTDDGRIFSGSNVENASYGATICAERTAAVKAASSGSRVFVAIAIAGSEEGASDADMTYAYPCGICRQFLREFLPPGGDMLVLVARSTDDYRESSLNELFPQSFGPSDLDYLRGE